ncbi:hypothetical protein DRO97_06600 [Archaeoglobales archaeon]|nr:MAG: hypothetical protein DRO97_06600 [Archaeoglobales archaeon]
MFEGVIAEIMRLDGVEGVAIVGKDGLMIEHEFRRKVDPELVAAMAVSIYKSSLEGISKILGDVANHTMVEGGVGKIIVFDAGENAILCAITQSDVNLGLIRTVMKNSAKKVAMSL